jgi:hypothetical protein
MSAKTQIPVKFDSPHFSIFSTKMNIDTSDQTLIKSFQLVHSKREKRHIAAFMDQNNTLVTLFVLCNSCLFFVFEYLSLVFETENYNISRRSFILVD